MNQEFLKFVVNLTFPLNFSSFILSSLTVFLIKG